MATRKTSGKRKTRAKSKVSTEERDQARAVADQQLEAMSEPGLYWEHYGRFCYVYYDGAPLGRFGYKGDPEEWEIAIYKYSTDSYSSKEFAKPCRGPIQYCVIAAMDAYNLG
jgi:hypothetical protein